MKILYHHRTASKDGQAVHIEEMIAALRELGNEVRIVAPAVGGEGEMGGKLGWVHRLKDALPRALYELLELAYTLVAYRQLKAAVDDFRPDFIYERYNLFLLAGVMLSKRARIPLLLEVNSPLVFERSQHSGGLALKALARWAEATAWRGAHCVLPVTQVLAAHVMAYGVLPERIAVIANGINETHFTSALAPPDARQTLGLAANLVLGFTGFVRQWHGVDRVIRWMATPAAPANAFLLVVGDGPVRAELEKLAGDLAIAHRVRFTGVVARDEIPNYVAAFDIALQPAVTAYASPLKLMEYLVLGKAIIAPSEPNLLEILADGENALMFASGQKNALEECLSRLCADAGLRARLGEGARKSIGQRQLTWRANATRVVALARKAIDDPRP